MTGAVALVAAVLVLAAIVGFVASPLVLRWQPAEAPGTAADLEAVDRRDRALAALRELEFDHRTGKIADDDYDALLGLLRSEAAQALQVSAEARA